MEGIIFILIILVLFVIVLPLVAIVKASDASGKVKKLEREVQGLRQVLYHLKKEDVPPPETSPAEAAPGMAARALRESFQDRDAEREPVATPQETIPSQLQEVEPESVPQPASEPITTTPPQATPLPGSLTSSPPPIPDLKPEFATSMAEPKLARREPARAAASQSSSKQATSSSPPIPAPTKQLDWEAFMGAKMFAWIGGLALFLGLAFFVRYSFENNLISPAMRVTLGFVAGTGLLVTGVVLKRKAYAVTAHTLCATGILTLYACVYASSHAFYEFFSQPLSFALMVLVTATAFILAERLKGQVIAILGLLGGFLTPVLLSTGVDHPVALFSYIALLVAGLAALAIRMSWRHLIFLAAAATFFTQMGWAAVHFEASKVNIAMTVLLGFSGLFSWIFWWIHRGPHERPEIWSTISAIGMPIVALCFTFHFYSFADLRGRPGLLFSYVMLADALLLAVPWISTKLRAVQGIAAGLAFVLLSTWTMSYLKPDLLYWALGFFVLYAAFHVAYPILLQRHRTKEPLQWWEQCLPLLGICLTVLPMLRDQFAFAIWPTVLMLNALTIFMAMRTRSTLLVVASMMMTLVVSMTYINGVPVVDASMVELLVPITGFALVFFLVALLIGKKLDPIVLGAEFGSSSVDRRTESGSPAQSSFLSRPQAPDTMMAALASILPFALLAMVIGKLPAIPNPSAIFGVALLLCGMLIGLARMKNLPVLGGVALGGAFVLLQGWFNSHHFGVANAGWALNWFVVFYAIFTMFPFLLSPEQRGKSTSWAVSAIAGPLHYLLIFELVDRAWPSTWMTLIPAVMAIPPLCLLFYAAKSIPSEEPERNTILAWMGGSALFFLTLILPVEFDKAALTLGWVLEAVALLWLYHRVPHNGLRIVGVGLLALVFLRLALNPFVLDYYPRSGTPVFNWYLGAYGVSAAAFFLSGWLLNPPRNRLFHFNIQPWVYACGLWLTFALLNIEIADFYSTGSRLTLDFTGSFAQGMTYSIAWALFALPLLLIGMVRRLPACRYAGLGLIVVTLFKLFVFDLSQLDQLFRIGAFLGVAIVVIAASILYQRFLAKVAVDEEKTKAES